MLKGLGSLNPGMECIITRCCYLALSGQPSGTCSAVQRRRCLYRTVLCTKERKSCAPHKMYTALLVPSPSTV